MGNETIPAYINPLAFIELEMPLLEKTLTAESILRYVCAPVAPDGVAIAARYREINALSDSLFFAPAESNILEKLVWPLKHAKSSYIVGNYLGSISLCGMVAEMISILLFEISELSVNGQPLDDDHQKKLFGSSFEKLAQERRVQVLKSFKVIDEPVAKAFTEIRLIRRQYLHLWSKEHARIAEDARNCFRASMELVLRTLSQQIIDGKIRLNPLLTRYLRKLGLFHASATE